MKISQKTRNGFTLIELLVVISIISLLSSVILAALSGARDKARISSGIQFASHNYQAFGADAVGIWNFNEGGTGAPIDSSGNNLTPDSNPTLYRSQNTPYTNGYSGDFSNSGSQYLNFTLSATQISKLISPLTTSNHTMSAWVYPTAISNNPLSIISIQDNGQGYGPTDIIYLTKSGSNIYLKCGDSFDSGGGQWGYGLFLSINTIPLNKWTQVACSYNSSKNTYAIYIDGKFDTAGGSKNLSIFNGNYSYSGDHIAIGSYEQPGANMWTFNGYLDDVAIYNSALSLLDIQKIYADGLQTHQNLADK